jgi:hypothetical protein
MGNNQKIIQVKDVFKGKQHVNLFGKASFRDYETSTKLNETYVKWYDA